jgi:hypothetical protein
VFPVSSKKFAADIHNQPDAVPAPVQTVLTAVKTGFPDFQTASGDFFFPVKGDRITVDGGFSGCRFQLRLIALYPDQVMIAAFYGFLQRFLQCRASGVNTASFKSSISSRFSTVCPSLPFLFSGLSTCSTCSRLQQTDRRYKIPVIRRTVAHSGADTFSVNGYPFARLNTHTTARPFVE